MPETFREIRAARLAAEVGTIHKQAGLPFALCYPSPYAVGMSSLGFQTVYRTLNGLPDVSAERAFLPDDAAAARVAGEPLRTYESARSSANAGTGRTFPLVVVGGPLTFSNPVPAAPYADVILLGEAEETLPALVDAVRERPERGALLAALAARPGFYVPSIHGEALPAIAKAADELLPARSQVRTPHTELADMFLIEPERGCHRGCTYCVMRRSTNGGMRLVAPDRVKALIPDDARRVGLVGAAVTDHPGLPEILRHIVDSGREVGISSLRADRLTDEIVGLLKRGGYRTLTTASDGASERMRDVIQRRTKERHLLAAAALCRAHQMTQLKLYMMLGLPGETDADIDELARFSLELARVAPRVALGIAPFVAKRNTPLDGAPFEPIASIDAKLARLRAALKGRVEIRPTSPKWAWVEYRLAQGGMAAGRAAARAARAGGRFADWKAAFADVPPPAVAPVQPPSTAMASISIKAPLGRPAA